MDPREYTRAKEYHAELLRVSRQEQALRQAGQSSQPVRLSILDRAFLFSGNTLIAAGQKLRSRVVVYQFKEDCL